MPDTGEPKGCHALLLTGVYGSGKSTVVEEIAAIFEERGTPYAAIDLDWLGWFDVGWDDEDAEFDMMIRNLAVVVANYLGAGIRYLLLALSIEQPRELDAIKAVSPSPFYVVRLTAELQTISSRLASDPTTGRQVDLKWAGRWLQDGTGEGLEDFSVANDRPIRDVANDVLGRLGWA